MKNKKLNIIKLIKLLLIKVHTNKFIIICQLNGLPFLR